MLSTVQAYNRCSPNVGSYLFVFSCGNCMLGVSSLRWVFWVSGCLDSTELPSGNWVALSAHMTISIEEVDSDPLR